MVWESGLGLPAADATAALCSTRAGVCGWSVWQAWVDGCYPVCAHAGLRPAPDEVGLLTAVGWKPCGAPASAAWGWRGRARAESVRAISQAPQAVGHVSRQMHGGARGLTICMEVGHEPHLPGVWWWSFPCRMCTGMPATKTAMRRQSFATAAVAESHLRQRARRSGTRRVRPTHPPTMADA